MRVLFAGTPDVAVPSVEAIAASTHEVVAVLTRPDAPSGRGRRLTRSPVAQWADDHDVPVMQPKRLSEPAALQAICDLALDCAAVVAYGALVPKAALTVPRHGWVNLHFSLLPAWRGAAPVQHALIVGDEITGATTFALDEGLDTGAVYGVLTERVRARDTAGDLLGRLAVAGAPLLVATLDGLEQGALEARPQAVDGVSTAPKLTVEEARIDWAATASVIDRRVRGCTPEPGAWTSWRGERLGIGPLAQAPDGVAPDLLETAVGDDHQNEHRVLAPGELKATKTFVAVGTGGPPVLLGEVRPAGRRAMAAVDWARGARFEQGETLG